ncbi:MAG: EAL domain-containing protein [Pseudomonadota bacterium]
MSATITTDALDQLMPFHLRLDAEGRIVGVGRTLARIAERPLVGQPFFDAFTVRRPRRIKTFSALADATGQSLSIACLNEPPVTFRAMITPLADDGHLMNASLAAHMADVVDRCGLQRNDFAPSDNTIDLVFSLSTQKELLADAASLMERLRQSHAEAEKLAVTDALTGLANSRGLYEAFAAPLEGGAVLQLDIDHFKTINDTGGHEAGDAALIHAAAIFRDVLGEDAVIARTGGDEFVAVLPNVRRRAVEALARKIIKRVSAPTGAVDHGSLGVSIGIRLIADDGASADRLIADADLALFSAKRAGRQRFAVFEVAMRERFEADAATRRLIQDGLLANAFIPYFQPQVALGTGRTVGVEVLARLTHPERGVLAPGAFLDVAQRAGLLNAIDDQVRLAALDHFAAWRRAGVCVPALSLNITADRLGDQNFVERLTDEVFARNLDPRTIGLEVLETVLFDGAPTALSDAVHRLAERGFHIHLDDFGTGHTSMMSLIKLPVDKIKVDRSLVRDIHKDPDLRQMMRAVVEIARHLGVGVLAEGVEVDAEMDALAALGCMEIQGFGAARPMAAEAAARWLETRALTHGALVPPAEPAASVVRPAA